MHVRGLFFIYARFPVYDKTVRTGDNVESSVVNTTQKPMDAKVDISEPFEQRVGRLPMLVMAAVAFMGIVCMMVVSIVVAGLITLGLVCSVKMLVMFTTGSAFTAPGTSGGTTSTIVACTSAMAAMCCAGTAWINRAIIYKKITNLVVWK